MNKKLIAKELLKIAKELTAKEEINRSSPEFGKYYNYCEKSSRKFDGSGTTIRVSIRTKTLFDDISPVAAIRVSSSKELRGSEIDQFVSGLNEAIYYIKEREKIAQKLFELIPKK